MTTKRRPKADSTAPSIQLKSGYILLDHTGAEGGVRYQREVIDEIKQGETVTKVWKTTKHVDHDILVKRANAVVKEVDYILRKFCTRFGGGRSASWFADEAQWTAVKDALEAVKDKADDVNHSCALARCERRVYVSVVPARVDLATPDAAREVARTIQRRLGALRDCLATGRIESFDFKYFLPCKNLERLAVGIAAESIVFALDAAKSAKREIADKVKRGQTPESAGKQADLSAIDAAILMFAPMDESLSSEGAA